MIKFTWTGIDALGKKISGQITAPNKKTAINNLLLEKIILLSIKKHYDLALSKKFSKKTGLAFSEQLLLLLQSGITLSDSLHLLSESSTIKNADLLFKALQSDLNHGLAFSAALQKFPDYFSPTYCAMIFAGEESGDLSLVLLQLIQNQTQTVAMQGKIKKALFYPSTILIVAILISIGLLIFVIPQFSKIYSSFGAQLPTMTQSIITMSQTLIDHSVLSFFVIVSGLWVLKKIAKLAFLTQGFFFRKLHQVHDVAQWSQVMSMALNTHIHLPKALLLANQTLRHKKMRRQLTEVNNAVIEGKTLHEALKKCDYFPKHARQLIRIGEDADALNLMMEKIACYYHTQLSDHLDHLSKLIEPVIMVIIASLISLLIIAMYLPVFKMGSVI